MHRPLNAALQTFFFLENKKEKRQRPKNAAQYYIGVWERQREKPLFSLKKARPSLLVRLQIFSSLISIQEQRGEGFLPMIPLCSSIDSLLFYY
jgi:hypothetical protein